MGDPPGGQRSRAKPVRLCSEDMCEAPPHRHVVVARKTYRVCGRHRPEQIIAPWRGTIEQEQPSALQAWDVGQAVQKRIVLSARPRRGTRHCQWGFQDKEAALFCRGCPAIDPRRRPMVLGSHRREQPGRLLTGRIPRFRFFWGACVRCASRRFGRGCCSQSRPGQRGPSRLAWMGSCQRPSTRTSCSSGASPPTLHSPARGSSRGEAAKALCAATARRPDHRATHADRAAGCMAAGPQMPGGLRAIVATWRLPR